MSAVTLALAMFRLRDQLKGQNNRTQKSEEQIVSLESQLTEKMKQIKLKKDQIKKKGAYG